MPIGLISYMDDSRKESLLSILKKTSPNVDNYLFNNLGTSEPASQQLHQWTVFDAARPTSVPGDIEGADASFGDLTQPSRSTNFTQEVVESVKVSDSERAVSTANGVDPFVQQKAFAADRLKAKVEFLTINGVAASGSSGVARTMVGIDGVISTNVTARASGTSFTETELNDMIQESWNAVADKFVADVLLCPMVIKRRIATFTANNTRFINASEKKLVGDVQVYESQVGKAVMILPHKDVRAIAGSLTVYLIREDMYKHSFLKGREPYWSELSKTGTASKGQYVTEFTLVSFGQKASVRRTGYNTGL